MIRNKHKGILIDVEGLDGAGKTTAIKKALKKLNSEKFIYIKGVGSDILWGRIAKRYAKTIFFLFELLSVTNRQIRPELKKGKIVITDKYFFNVASHVPEVKNIWNKALIIFFKWFMIKPDLIIYFSVSLHERINRLKNGPPNKFHNLLILNPHSIIEREKEYRIIIEKFEKKVVFIDTSGLSIDEATEKLESIILNYKRGKA
jgi:thymidylate kinase